MALLAAPSAPPGSASPGSASAGLPLAVPTLARPPAVGRSAGMVARVMICDDSAVIRGALARILESDPEINVVAKVENGKVAVEQIRASQVDVVVLDIEMPGMMDGLTALPLLLRADPGDSDHHGVHPDHARRGYRPSCAAPGSVGLSTETIEHRYRQRRRLQAGTAGESQRSCPPASPPPNRPAARRSSCGPHRRSPRVCSPSAVRRAARRRCSPWCRGWDDRSAYLSS